MPDKKPTVLAPVTNRRVVHINGFEPITPAVLDRRMQSGLRRFAPVWKARATAPPPEVADDGRSVTWQVETVGPDWTTRCRYTVLRWDELMMPYVERSWIGRIVHGYLALFEFISTGTLRRYFKANVRYGLFFIYPFLALAGFLLGGIAAWVAVGLAGMPYAGAAGPVAGVIVFLLLLRFVGSYLYLDFALADWAFAADLCRRDVPGLEDILDQYAREVDSAMRDPEADEVLLSGVSLGAVMMVEAIARAFAASRDLGPQAARAAFLTVGSSILKIGLHPAAARLKNDVYRVGAEASLLWVEYQAKVDPINFYKTDPVADLGNPATGRPIVRMVRIRDMMSADDYRRAQRSSLHLHRQFVMPNARRYFYDFYQIGFGPLRLADRVALGAKATSAFARNGAFRTNRRPAARRRAALATEK